MLKFFVLACLVVLGALATLAAAVGGPGWWVLLAIVVLLLCLAVYDVTQKRHSILRNYPVLGHFRFLLEDIRPELQQYFIERNWDGRPFDRDTRTSIYQRAKDLKTEQPFGTERDVDEPGYEYLVHSTRPVDPAPEPPRVRIGGPRLHPALRHGADERLGDELRGAERQRPRGPQPRRRPRRVRPRHGRGRARASTTSRAATSSGRSAAGTSARAPRTATSTRRKFADTAAGDQVKMVSLKLSQGAKPGIGGVLPGAKVTQEIAEARGVPEGREVRVPARTQGLLDPARAGAVHRADARALRAASRPGSSSASGRARTSWRICKAMVAEGVTPDFVIVDGGEGGTGAAPLEYEDHVGTPLTEGLLNVHNALVGVGLRDRVKIGASGKVATGIDIVKRLVQGADYTNSARSMMMAVGCIQAQLCHTNTCPVGVATQDPKRARALDVPEQDRPGLPLPEGLRRAGDAGDGLDGRARPRRACGRTCCAAGSTTTGWPATPRCSTTSSRASCSPRLRPGTWERDWALADPDRFTP